MGNTGTLITELPTATGLTGAEVFPIVQGGTTKQAAVSLIPGINLSPRIQLTQTTTYYVSPSGSDSTGDGSASSPWATANPGIDYIFNSLDLAGQDVIIQFADGAYSGNVATFPTGGWVGGGSVTFQGNDSSPTSCSVDVLDQVGFDMFNGPVGGSVFITGFKIFSSSASSSARGIRNSTSGCLALCGNINFGTMTNGIHMIGSGYFYFYAPYTISGNVSGHINLEALGFADWEFTTVTLTGNPSLGTFVSLSEGATFYSLGMTYTGAATGKKFNAVGGSRILGDSITAIPGNTAGTLGSEADTFVIYPTSVIADRGPSLTYTFATLPTAVQGKICTISDSSSVVWGTAITAGGGANKALLWYNGTNWTVAGK